MKDYILFVKNNDIIEINNNKKYDYILLNSVTKLITLLGFLDCIKKHNLSIHDKIKKVFPNYEYNYKFIDIINHKTTLQTDWLGSTLHTKYKNSKNIYEFVLNIKEDPNLKKGFNYSNYTYDILAYVIYKLEKKYINKYLENSILKNVAYRWLNDNNKPFGSYGLFINTSSCKIFAENLIKMISLHDLSFFWDQNLTIKIKNKNYKLIGHTGTGGQYLFFNKKLKCLMFWFAYGYNFEKNGKIRTEDKYLDLFTKIYNS